MRIDVRSDRLNRGMSQAALAREIGVSEDIIRNVESTGRMPQPRNALQIANYYGMSVVEMWPADEPNGDPVAA